MKKFILFIALFVGLLANDVLANNDKSDEILRKSGLNIPAGPAPNSAGTTYPIQFNEVIDLVLQNRRATFGCVLHPWHTHGHSHYVIASGTGDYDHSKDKDIRNFANPIYRDTTVAYPSLEVGPNKGCGWTKVRILAVSFFCLFI